MASKKAKIPPLVKWTIILYSMGIVVIGYKSLEETKGSIFNYIKQRATVLANERPRPSNIDAPRSVKVQKNGSVSREIGHSHDKDSLTLNDRKALNSLIDGL